MKRSTWAIISVSLVSICVAVVAGLFFGWSLSRKDQDLHDKLGLQRHAVLVVSSCHFGEWGPWQGTCSNEALPGMPDQPNCTGFQYRTRELLQQSTTKPCPPSDLVEERPCADTKPECKDQYQDCVLSQQWSEWSGCPDINCYDKCGDIPQEYRYRDIVTPNGPFGKPCTFGDMFEFRACTRTADDGTPVPIPPCNTCGEKRPVNCVPEPWDNVAWEGCPATCTPDSSTVIYEYRHRQPRIEAQNGGLDCAPEDMVQKRVCATTPCHGCEYEDWSSQPWSRCSLPCGPGTQFRVRDVIKYANDGRQCPDTVEHRECNLGDCPTGPVPDCVEPTWDMLVAECGYLCDHGSSRAPRTLQLEDANGNVVPSCTFTEDLLDLVCPRTVSSTTPASPSNPRDCNFGSLDCQYQPWSETVWGPCSIDCLTSIDGANAGQRVRQRDVLSQGLAISPCQYSQTHDSQPCNQASDFSDLPILTCNISSRLEALATLDPDLRDGLVISSTSAAWTPSMTNVASRNDAEVLCGAMDNCAAFEMNADQTKLLAIYAVPADVLLDNNLCAGSPSSHIVIDAPCQQQTECEYSSWAPVVACPACYNTEQGPASAKSWEGRTVIKGPAVGTCTEPLFRSQPCPTVPPCNAQGAPCVYGPWPSNQPPGNQPCEDLNNTVVFTDAFSPNTVQAWAHLSPAIHLDEPQFQTVASVASTGLTWTTPEQYESVLKQVLNSQTYAGLSCMPLESTLVPDSIAFTWRSDGTGWDVISAADSLTNTQCPWTTIDDYRSRAQHVASYLCGKLLRDPERDRCVCPGLCPLVEDYCDWSPCDGVCGQGRQMMMRDIVKGPVGNGEPCDITQQIRTRDCDTGRPCGIQTACPYGKNGQLCSGPSHGYCVTSSSTQEQYCDCVDDWFGPTCDFRCPLSQRTEVTCNIMAATGWDQHELLTVHDSSTMNVSLIYSGMQVVSSTHPNECNAEGICECKQTSIAWHSGWGGIACDEPCLTGKQGTNCDQDYNPASAYDGFFKVRTNPSTNNAASSYVEIVLGCDEDSDTCPEVLLGPYSFENMDMQYFPGGKLSDMKGSAYDKCSGPRKTYCQGTSTNRIARIPYKDILWFEQGTSENGSDAHYVGYIIVKTGVSGSLGGFDDGDFGVIALHGKFYVESGRIGEGRGIRLMRMAQPSNTTTDPDPSFPQYLFNNSRTSNPTIVGYYPKTTLPNAKTMTPGLPDGSFGTSGYIFVPSDVTFQDTGNLDATITSQDCWQPGGATDWYSFVRCLASQA